MEADVEELVGELRERGVTLSARGGDVVARGPRGAITESLAAEIRELKGDLLRWLDGIVVWEGACSECGTAVKGAGMRGVFVEPRGPVTCMWCAGRITNATNGAESDEWGGEQ